MVVSKDFADYCCELLSGVGKPTAKCMFGSWGISVEGMSIAWLLDLSDKGTTTLCHPRSIRSRWLPTFCLRREGCAQECELLCRAR